MKNYFKGRKILICREITKYYEEFIRFDLEELQTFKDEPKGELTVVISDKKINKKASQNLSESDKRIIQRMKNKLTVKEIIEIIGEKTKVSKKEIYNYYLDLKSNEE